MLKKLFYKYPQAVTAFLSALILQPIELFLIETKYYIFTGGFQSEFEYSTLTSASSFILGSLTLDFLVFFTLALIWFHLFRKSQRHTIYVAFSYLVILGSVVFIGIFSKYKLVSYFSDAVNYTIIKNLGGGDVGTAIAYSFSEIVYNLIFITLYIIAVFILLQIIKRFVPKTGPTPYVSRLRHIAVSLVMLVAFCSWLIGTHFEYGGKRKVTLAATTQILNKLSDVDFDGYGVYRRPYDFAPFNGKSYPGVIDTPDNGIDENQIAGDLSLIGLKQIDPLSTLPKSAGKNIVVIFSESTRSDVVGKVFNGQEVAPNVNRLAAEGSAIAHAYSHIAYTSKSIKSFFNQIFSLADKPTRLLDYLRGSGYAVSIISGQSENWGNIDTAVGMEAVSADDYFFDSRSDPENRIFPGTAAVNLKLSAARIADEFASRMEIVNWQKPQFFYLNLQSGHFPYANKKMTNELVDQPIPRADITPGNKDWIQATYWNAMRNADNAVGKVVQALKAAGQFDNTVLVFIGDHGEALFEDDVLGHGHAMTDAQLQIPLVLNQPLPFANDLVIGHSSIAGLVAHLAQRKSAEQWYRIYGQQAPLQVVGILSAPVQIATVRENFERDIYDFRDQRFYSAIEKAWFTQKETDANPQLQKDRNAVVNLWETLNYFNRNSSSD